jgi:Fe-Mn family superoxide dismutase
MEHLLPELPFEQNALEPDISSETIEYHYGKHHAAYVKKLNDLIPTTRFENMSLEEIIKTATGSIFNNAAQIWNHTFYWQCLTPGDKSEPTGSLLKAIKSSFGSYEEFKTKFSEQAVSNFGSGWTWLTKDKDGKLEIINTSNAGTPLTEDKTPLLTCDVWEHAYYIDYRNARAKYVDSFWNLVNWDFVEQNFSG